jgi:hypothetical protein
MNYVRRSLDFGCRVAALFFLLLQAFSLPKMPDIVMGSLLQSRFEELVAMPPQERVGDLSELQVIREIRGKTPPAAVFLTFIRGRSPIMRRDNWPG